MSRFKAGQKVKWTSCNEERIGVFRTEVAEVSIVETEKGDLVKIYTKALEPVKEDPEEEKQQEELGKYVTLDDILMCYTQALETEEVEDIRKELMKGMTFETGALLVNYLSMIMTVFSCELLLTDGEDHD